MVKIQISVKYPKISYISPYRLTDEMNVASRVIRIMQLNTIIAEIERWADAERNYNT